MGGHDIKTDGTLGHHMSCFLFLPRKGRTKFYLFTFQSLVTYLFWPLAVCLVAMSLKSDFCDVVTAPAPVRQTTRAGGQVGS